MHIGFAGVGRMGTHMVRRFLEAGHTVTAYDLYLTPDTAPAELVDLGMTITTTPADLARAEISFSMLPDAAATEEVLFGEHGIATAGAAEHLHVVMGTVGPTAVREFAERAAGSGTAVVDAPVSGSVSLAETGQITTMVGCDDEQFTYLKPVLEAVTRAQFHTGAAGTASVAKLAVNSVLAALNQAVAEALILGESAGLAPAPCTRCWVRARWLRRTSATRRNTSSTRPRLVWHFHCRSCTRTWASASRWPATTPSIYLRPRPSGTFSTGRWTRDSGPRTWLRCSSS